jgi:hypothetical protein
MDLMAILLPVAVVIGIGAQVYDHWMRRKIFRSVAKLNLDQAKLDARTNGLVEVARLQQILIDDDRTKLERIVKAVSAVNN